MIPRWTLLRAIPAVAFAWLVATGLASASGGDESRPQVIAAEAAVERFPLAVEGLGTARANESVDIRPQISQVVTAIHFEEGQTVAQGQVLVELEDSEARADVAAARAALVDSESQVKRAEELFRTKALSESELTRRQAQRDADRAALAAAVARLADAKVRAPFAGRLGLRRVSLGAAVGPATVITTLDDTDPIKLDFEVPETAIALLAVGLPVEAHSAAWPDVPFRGRVIAIDTRVDPVTRSITLRAQIPNADQQLRPGMFLTTKVMREDVEALLVPEQAIVPEQSRQYVLVVDPEGNVERRLVRTGRRRPGQVEILEGLVSGERVVAEGTQKARPGTRVEVRGLWGAAPGPSP